MIGYVLTHRTVSLHYDLAMVIRTWLARDEILALAFAVLYALDPEDVERVVASVQEEW